MNIADAHVLILTKFLSLYLYINPLCKVMNVLLLVVSLVQTYEFMQHFSLDDFFQYSNFYFGCIYVPIPKCYNDK